MIVEVMEDVLIDDGGTPSSIKTSSMTSTINNYVIINHVILSICWAKGFLTMLEKNSLPLGILIGLLVPILGFAVFYGIFELLDSANAVSDTGFRPKFRERTCGILGIAMNVMALNYYSKRKYMDSVRGVVVLTTVWVVVWMILFGKHVL